jgi:hypothetical protein
VDADGDLIGKSWYFGMLSPDWVPQKEPEDVAMLWSREEERWIETQVSLGEVHLDNPHERMSTFGGAEPTPDYEMTVEEVRSIVRKALSGD